MTDEKPKKKKSGGWFVLNTIAIALLVMAAMHEFAPYFRKTYPNTPQVMEYAATIQTVAPNQVVDLLASDNGKPSLMVVYASWCGTCRLKMPGIIDMMRDGSLDHVNVVFISMDRELMKLSAYLVGTGFYKEVTPYFFRGYLGGPGLSDVLKSKGSSFVGSIPFMELYSPEGKALTFIPHFASKEAILKATKTGVFVD